MFTAGAGLAAAESLIWSIGCAGALASLCVSVALIRRRRRSDGGAGQALRLAREIVSVARTIDADLAGHVQVTWVTDISGRCRAYRACAEKALAKAGDLKRLDADRIASIVQLLHEDHLKIANLRSDADRATNARGASTPGRNRLVTYGPPSPSRWDSSGMRPRPSTFT